MNSVYRQKIKLLITEQTGLRVLDDQADTFARLIGQRKKALKLTSDADYLSLLQNLTRTQLADEYAHLSRDLTTGETYFFRDHGQLELLSQQLLPELIERNRAKRRLRIWSAGCSSGEEAYSLAMLLDEMSEDLSAWQVTILGTDINPEALLKAQQGHYREWSFRQVSEQRRQRYFIKEHKHWTLRAPIRQQVQFRSFNLVTENFPDARHNIEQMDLILCRNVFIYLEPDRVSQVADKMTASLSEGGYLMTGHSELYAHHLGGLRTRVFPSSIVYQKHSMTAAQALVTPTTEAVVKSTLDIKPSRTAVRTTVPAKRSQTMTKPPVKQPVPVLSIQDAWAYANQGKSEQARLCCTRLIAQNSLNHQPYYLTALLDQEAGDFAAAKLLLKKVLYLAPDFISAYLELGDLYAKENNAILAQKMWLSARDLLQALAQDQPVEMFGNSTAKDILQFIENRLN